MKNNLCKSCIVLLLGLFSAISAIACDYTVVLYDSYGDGWNGGALTVYVNGTAVQTGLTIGSGGTYGPITITVNTGDVISTDYSAGSWSYENSYKFYDYNGVEVASMGDASLESLIVSCPGVNVTGWIQPGSVYDAGTAVFPEVIIANTSADTVSNFDVYYAFGVDTIMQVNTTTMLPGDIDTMLFTTSIIVPVGNFTVCAWTIDPTSTTGTIVYNCVNSYGTPAIDAGVVEILAPLDQTVEGETAIPTVIIQNFGTAILTSSDINYAIGGVAATPYTWTGSLASGETDTVNLPGFTMPGVAADICAFTQLTGDVITNNDSTCAMLDVLAASCNYALSFDGSGDWVEIPSDSTLNSTDYTLEAWVKPAAFSWLAGVISRYPSGGPSGYVLRLSGSWPYSKMGFNEGEANETLVTNQWYHVAAVRANGTNTLYINGVPYAVGGSALSGDNNALIQIGVDYSNRWWNGLIDEVRIWGTGLSQAEITEWMVKPVDNAHPAYNDLMGYWNFDQPGGMAVDSKNNNDGIIHNAVYAASDAPFVCGDYDAWITEFNPAINQSVAGQPLVPSVSVTNMGLLDITSMDISYSVNGGTATTFTYTGAIASGANEVIALPSFIATAGTSEIVAWVDLANDVSALNDTIASTFESLNDICNYSLDLNGTAQYAQLPADNYFGSQFSVEGWVYKRSNNNQSRFIDFGNGDNDNVIITLSDGTSGNVAFTIRQGTTEQQVVTTTPLATNQWVHLAITYDGVAGRIYYNGVEQASGSVHNAIPMVRNNCFIGKSNWSSDAYADVNIDEFRIWNTTLLPATIGAYLNVPADANHPNYADLAMYYNFNQAVENPVIDQAGLVNLDMMAATYSENSAPVVCDPYDAAITGIVVPAGILFENAQETPEVVLTNLGVQPLTAANIYFSFGTDTLVYAYSGNLLLGESDTVALSAITVPTGAAADLCVWVELANDANAGNDMFCQNYTLMVNACNYALYFDGNSDYVQVPNSPDVANLGAIYTLECWINPDEFEWLDGLISKYQTSASFTLRMGQNSPYNTLNFDEQDAGPVMQTNQWYHIAAVNNNGVHKLYVNGVEYLTSAAAVYAPSSSYIRFGSDYNGRYYKGLMDEVRIWEAALTQSDITTWMNQPITNAHSEYVNLVGYWKFDDLAPVATDSKNSNDGTINDCIYVPCDAPFACGSQDAGVSAIVTPLATCLEGNLNNVEVEIFNFGTDTITSMDIAYTLNGGTPVVYSWTGNLAPVTGENVMLPSFVGPAGTSTLVVYTMLTGDVVTYNDAAEVTFDAIPAYELAMFDVLSPLGGCGMTTAELVTVELENNGDTIVTGLTMYYMIENDTANIVSEVFSGMILPNSIYQYTFATPANLYVGTGLDSMYNFEVWFDLAFDADSTNNDILFDAEAIHASNAPIGYGTTVIYGDTAVLTASSTAPVFWYDAPVGGNLVSTDTFMITPPLFDTVTYYAFASESVPDTIQIGTGTSTTNYIPLYGYYDYSWSSCLYTQAEIGASMEITSIAYEVGNTPNNYTTIGQKIYMANTSDVSFADGTKPDASMMELVYEGDITWNGAGWHEIALDVPFTYNGTDNLEIFYENWDGSYSSGYPNFKYTSNSGMAKYKYADYNMPGDATSTSYYRANIQLNGSSVGCPSEPEAVTAMVTNVPDYDLSVTALISPQSGFVLSNCEPITVEIQNFGAQTVTYCPIYFEMDNGFIISEYFNGSLASGQTATYTFITCVDLSVVGDYNACVYTAYPNDANTVNDSICTTISNVPLTYCVSSANYSSYIEVTTFGINGWVNTSGPASGALYSDFTALAPAEVILGQTVSTIVDPSNYGYSYGTFSNYKIYIDYNQDGVFHPTNEMAFGTNVWADNLSYGQITIPQTALAGTTGMRLVFNRTSNASAVSPCGTYSYGETEDYMITLHGPIPQDAGITDIIEPSGFMIENYTENVQVEVQNFGSDTITSVDIVYEVNGLNPVTYTWTGALAPFTSTLVDLADLTVPQLGFDFCAYTVLTGDVNTGNDSLCTTLYGDPQFQVELVSVSGVATGCNLGMADVSITFENLADTIFPGMLTMGYSALGVTGNATATFNDMLTPADQATYTFAVQLDQTVAIDTEIELTAWVTLTNDPFTANDTLVVLYSSGVSPANPVVNDVTIFANQFTTVAPVTIDSTLNYDWYNQYMSLMATDYSLTTPTLTDTTMYYVQAANSVANGGCISDLVPFYVNVEYADYDVQINDVINPVSASYLTSAEAVQAIVYNNGLNPVFNFDVNYTLNGGAPVTETITDTIQPGDQLVYTFAASANLFQAGYGPLLDGYGIYDICVYSTLVNDGFNGNDTVCVSVENQNGNGDDCSTSYPYGFINDPAVYGATNQALDFEWWSFEVSGNYSNVAVSLCGSSYDTKLEVWDSCGAVAYLYYNDDSYSNCGPGNNSYISIPSLLTGTYYVKVYGYSNYFGSYTLSITGTEDAPFELDLVGTDVDCNGGNTGAVDLTVNNITGVAPFTYIWSNLEVTEDISGLAAGIYDVSVIDAMNDTVVGSITILENDQLVATAVVTNASTFGGADGAIDLTVVGGASPYVYAWPFAGTTEDLSSLTAGVYTVTVTDDLNCVVEQEFEVVSPMPLPAWNVNVTSVIHNIFVPHNALVSLDGSMVDAGSLIGLFYESNGSFVCGGYTFYTPGLGAKVVAYGSDPGMNNGFAPGESFKWKVWNASETDAYSAIATYNTSFYPNDESFAIGGLSGVLSIEAASIITQDITLPAGWSIWSTYVDPLDPSVDMVMAHIVAPCFTSGILEIVKNGAGQIYWPFYCLNTIGDIVIGEGYQAKTNSTLPETFGVTGLQVIPEITPFDIPSGWSILGYLRSTPADITTLLAPLVSPCFTAGCLEIAKNGAGQIYWPFYCLNTIGDMIPGEGYQVKLNCVPAPFAYPANTAAGTKLSEITNENPVNYKVVKATGDNMTVGIPADAWTVEPMIGDEIAIFNSNNEVVGSTVYTGAFSAITVWGKELLQSSDKGSNGEAFTMKLWHNATASEDVIVVEAWEQGNDEFASNAISVVGKLALASSADNGFALGQNMPNPFTGTTVIPFYTPEECNVTIEVYNSIGKLVKVVIDERLEAGEHQVSFDAQELSAGNYFYKLISEKYTSTKPMNIQ